MLSELGKALRAGDLSVAGSRRYKDFEEYLLPEKVYGAMKSSGLPLAVELDCDTYLQQRSGELDAEFSRLDRLVRTGQLQEASIIDGVLKLAPLHNQEPDEAGLPNPRVVIGKLS